MAWSAGFNFFTLFVEFDQFQIFCKKGARDSTFKEVALLDSFRYIFREHKKVWNSLSDAGIANVGEEPSMPKELLIFLARFLFGKEATDLQGFSGR
jgi:hypothetical protein